MGPITQNAQPHELPALYVDPFHGLGVAERTDLGVADGVPRARRPDAGQGRRRRGMAGTDLLRQGHRGGGGHPRSGDRLLVFLAAFVPLVGILVAGTIAVAVTLGTRGWVAALILVAVFILENQLESHLLQPLVVGRMVRFHPLAIILVLAVGGVVGGIAGAVVAVPIAAVLFRAMPYLLGRRTDAPDGPDPPGAVPRAG